MKKTIARLFVIVMSLSLLTGCGDAKKDLDKGDVVDYEDQYSGEEERGVITKTYDVTDYNTGETMVCEITYDSSVLAITEEIFDDVEPVTNLSEEPECFYHTESPAQYEVTVIPGPSAQQYYESDTTTYEGSTYYTSAEFSELKTKTYGTIDVKTYTLELLWMDDGEEKDLDRQYWLIEFEEGIMLIQTYGDIEEFSAYEEDLKDLLIGVTLNGNAPKSAVSVENTAIMPASDWFIPTIKIDGVIYTFPMEAQELLDNGWEMNDFPVPASPGTNSGVDFTKGELRLFTNISSTTGMEQPIKEGEVCAISYSEEYGDITDVPMEFPGGIALGMSKADVEQILPDEFEYNAEYQYFKYIWKTEKGKMDIRIYLSDDGSIVDEISYTCWTE